MALSIVDPCVNCWACVDLCPSQAISMAEKHFAIDPNKCSECEGHFADPQCASICPVEEAILDAEGVPLNPKGSLSGVASARIEVVRREIQAR